MRLIFWTILGLAISLSINVNGETFFYKTEKNPELTLHVFALQDTPQVRVTRKEITATQFGSCTVTWKKQSSQVSSLDALEYVGSFTLSSLDTSCTLDIADLFTSADAEELVTQRFTVSMESSSSLRTLSQFETAPKAQIATISSIIYISLESAIGSFELDVNAGGWNLQQVQIALTGELRNLGINLLSAKCKDMGCQTLAVQYEFMTERYAIFLNKSLSPSSVMIQLPAESVKSESLVPSIKVIFNADEVADVTTRKLSEEKVVLEFVLSDRIWLKNDLILLKKLFLHYIFKRWPTDITVNHTTIALSGRKAVLTLNISNFDIFLIHTPALEYHEVLERIASFIYPNNGMKLSTKSSSLNVLQNVELLWNYKESGIIQVPQNSLSTGPRLTQIPESVRDAAFYVELVGPDCEWMDFQHPAQVEVEGGVILLVEDWTFLLDLPHNFRAVHVFAVAHPTLPNVRFFRLSEDWILDIQEIGFTTTYHEHIELKDNVCFHNVVSLIHSPAQLRCELLTAPRHLRADELMWNSIALRPTVLLALDGNCEWRQKLLEDSREKLLKELLPSKIWSAALLASTALTLVDDHTIRISFGLDPSLDLASDERLSVDLSALQQMLRFGSAKVSNAQDLVIQVAEKSELQLIKIFKIVSAVGVSHPLSVSLMQNMILPSWMACQQPSTRFLGYQVQWVMSPLAAVLPVLHQKLPWEINCLLWNFVLLGLILVLYVMGITLVPMCCGHNPIFAGIFSSLMSSLVDFTYFAIIYWVYRSFFMENSLIYLALTVPTLVLYGFILPVSALFWMVMRMPCKVAWVPSSYGWFAPVGVWSPSKEVTETGFLYFEYRDRWYTGKFFVCAFLHFTALLGAAQIPEEMGCHLRLAIWAFLCLFMALWYFIARPSRWLVLDLLRGFVMTLLTILLLLCYITQSGVSLAIFFLASLLTCLLIVPLMWYFSLSDGYWSKRISIENKWALQKRQEYVEMMKLTNAPKEESKNKDSNKDYTQPIQVELVGQSFLNSISHTHEYEFVEAAPRTAVTNLTFLEGIFSTINGDYANKKSTVFDIDNMEYNAAMNFEEEPLSLTTLEALLPEPPQYTENTSGIKMSNSQLNSSYSPAEVSQSTE